MAHTQISPRGPGPFEGGAKFHECRTAGELGPGIERPNSVQVCSQQVEPALCSEPVL